MKNKLFIFIICTSTYIQAAYAQKKPDFVSFINQKHTWVENTFNSLSPRERIAQLFLVRAHTDRGTKYIDSVARVIEKEKLGGLVVFQGGPVRHANMFNKYQKLSKVPLLITFDGEWGVGMRLPDSTISFPYQMTLGAIQNEQLIRDMGIQVAKDFKRMGMHFNFAPVVDINNNPDNPVINFRSFGDDKENVTSKAKAYMDGMVEGGIIASLKHFPGHGDTDIDSHHDLPQLDFSRKRLEELEMYPFRELIQQGAPAIMVAHMHIPALDDTPHIPSSISKKIVNDILRDELGFKGLSVTDAMDMQGVKKFFPNGEADVMAIEAGNDLLEISENSHRAIRLVEESIKKGRIQQSDIDKRVKRVLAAKLWLGLDKYKAIDTRNLYQDLNSTASKQLVQKLADASVTVLRSRRGINAFNTAKSTFVLSIGTTTPQYIETILPKKIDAVRQVYLRGDEGDERIEEVLLESRQYAQVLLIVHDSRSRPRSELAFSNDVKKLTKKITNRRMITVMHTNPYALNDIDVDGSGSVILGYQNDEFMQRAVIKVLFKEKNAEGKLPVKVSRKFRFGTGL